MSPIVRWYLDYDDDGYGVAKTANQAENQEAGNLDDDLPTASSGNGILDRLEPVCYCQNNDTDYTDCVTLEDENCSPYEAQLPFESLSVATTISNVDYY